MGSGHFLVSLVDWLADKVLAAMAESAALVDWAAYVSPLAARIATIREKILRQARTHKWPIVESQLDDRHVVRRMVLKRVVYGVDKNPMAVELAKVALWLHSFTVGAPLSFLDHHLRAGDSVIGACVRPTVDALRQRGALFNLGQLTSVERIAGVMAEIEETTDNDVAEVAASKAKFGTVEEVTEPVAALFSLLTAEQMLGVFDAAPTKRPQIEKLIGAGKTAKQLEKARSDLLAFERGAALQLVLEGTFGDPIKIASGAQRVAPPELVKQLTLLPMGPPDQANLFPAISVDDRRRVTADDLVEEARAIATRHRFLHWEIAFPNVWSRLASAEPQGGFDAIIGNPPYVRHELLGDQVKRVLKKAYEAFDGMADLYVYFYEQGLRLLRPGGRMSYVVTNKWMKASYAENLRDLFVHKGWLEFVADFGHAKHFFPDADVFPSVLVVRKPDRTVSMPPDADICVIPRDAVPKKGLMDVVAEATFPLPRAIFSKEAWLLEPKPVMDLLEKIKRSGVPIADYIGSAPLSGLKTGLNRAYIVDLKVRDQLVFGDSGAANVIFPMIRGQDVGRWWSPPTQMFIILLKSSANFKWPWSDAADESTAEEIFARSYPLIYRHMKKFETWIDPESKDSLGLRHRDDQGRFWWELRSNAYYEQFTDGYIAYQDIAYHPSFELKFSVVPEMTAFCLPSNNRFVLASLNSPILWYYMSRKMLHGKDEALRLKSDKMQFLPIPRNISQYSMDMANSITTELETQTRRQFESNNAILDWLRHEFHLDKPSASLAQSLTLDADAFVAAVRKTLPKSHRLSASDIARLKQEHWQTIEPARRAANEALALERRLSDLVNAAYGLTPEEIALMWATAPPRMPLGAA
jgi:16S rRNA G1207 methylase RsmC